MNRSIYKKWLAKYLQKMIRHPLFNREVKSFPNRGYLYCTHNRQWSSGNPFDIINAYHPYQMQLHFYSLWARA